MADQLDKQIDAILGPSSAPTRDPIESQIDQLLGTSAVPPAPVGQVMSAKPQEAEGWERAAGLARNAVVGGLITGLGAPGDVLRALVGPTPDAYASDPNVLMYGGGSLPTTADLQTLIAPSGLLNATSLTPGAGPYPNLEKYGTATLSGAASAVPLAAVGGVEAAPWLVGQGAVGGLAGEGAKEIAPSSSAGPVVAGALAGGVLQGARNLLAGNPFKSVASSLGSSQTLDEAGVELQDAARNWKLQVMPQKEAAAWAPVDAAIPPTSPVSLTNFSSELSDINKSAGTLQPLADILSKPLASQLEKALGSTPPGQGIPTAWEDARQLRTMLGDAMADPRLVASIGEQNIKRLYRGITQDLGDTATNLGAGDEFAQANTTSTYLHDVAEGPMSKIVSGTRPSVADDPRPGDAASSLLVGGRRSGQDLRILRQEIPDAVDELVAAHLNYQPQLWNKMSPEAREALVPETRMRNILDTASASVSSSGLSKGISHLAGMNLGELIGLAAASHFGVPEWQAAGITGLAGYMLPTLGSAARSLTRPNVLGAEAVGAVGGASRLPAQAPVSP